MARKIIDKLTNYLTFDSDTEDKAASSKELAEVNQMSGSGKKTPAPVRGKAADGYRMVVVTPRRYEEVWQYADYLKDHVAVVINMQYAPQEIHSALREFMNGACYVLGGQVQYISEGVYLYVAANMEIDKELYGQSGSGYMHSFE